MLSSIWQRFGLFSKYQYIWIPILPPCALYFFIRSRPDETIWIWFAEWMSNHNVDDLWFSNSGYLPALNIELRPFMSKWHFETVTCIVRMKDKARGMNSHSVYVRYVFYKSICLLPNEKHWSLVLVCTLVKHSIFQVFSWLMLKKTKQKNPINYSHICKQWKSTRVNVAFIYMRDENKCKQSVHNIEWARFSKLLFLGLCKCLNFYCCSIWKELKMEVLTGVFRDRTNMGSFFCHTWTPLEASVFLGCRMVSVINVCQRATQRWLNIWQFMDACDK